MLHGVLDAAEALKGLQTPPYQADQTMIQKSFMTAVQSVKKEYGNDLRASRQLTTEAMAGIMTELKKDGNKINRSLTAGKLADAVVQHVKTPRGMNCHNPSSYSWRWLAR